MKNEDEKSSFMQKKNRASYLLTFATNWVCREMQSIITVHFQTYKKWKAQMFYANNNYNLLYRSKIVFIEDEVRELKEFLRPTCFIEWCTRETTNTTIRPSLLVYSKTVLFVGKTRLHPGIVWINGESIVSFEENANQLTVENFYHSRNPALHLHKLKKIEGLNSNFFKSI